MPVADAPQPPVALTIAGSDSCGGAGIQADLRTFAALGVWGASALTAVTAQNTTGVQAFVLLEPAIIAAQITSVAHDLRVSAVKTGMLGSAAIIMAVAAALRQHALAPLVVDPVMVAKSGDPLIDDAAVATLCSALLPMAAIVTPNRHEAARLLGLPSPPATRAQAEAAAQQICTRFGASACVVKGVREAGRCLDVLSVGGRTHVLEGPWHDAGPIHGSGCTFSAAVTAELARGGTVIGAVTAARQFIDTAIAAALRIGAGKTVARVPATFAR